MMSIIKASRYPNGFESDIALLSTPSFELNYLNKYEIQILDEFFN